MAAQSVLARCQATGERFTENAVRIALPGQSSGTTRKYLPVVLALLKAFPEEPEAEPSTADENLSAELEGAIGKIADAVAALTSAIGAEKNKIVAAHGEILHSTVAA